LLSGPANDALQDWPPRLRMILIYNEAPLLRVCYAA